MRIKRRMEQRAADRKLRDLEKAQEIAKEKAAKEKMATAEDYDNNQFIIRAAETDEEKKKRLDAKKEQFYKDFKPDFDIDEVPPLEWN